MSTPLAQARLSRHGAGASRVPREAEPLELPPPWSPPTRPTVPLLASVVPVLGAVALWAVTGSVLALWLAALGPLIAVATMVDAARGTRRDRRRADSAARDARERVARQIEERHAEERAHLWLRHPDVAAFAARDAEIWRPVAGRGELLVLGSGADASTVRVTGGGADPESVELRSRAATIADAPVTVPAASGTVVVGSAVLRHAVVRALVLQLCLTLPPGELRIVGALRGEHAWAERLPHRRAVTGRSLAIVSAGDPIGADADILIVSAASSGPRPPGCGAILTVSSLEHAVVDVGGELREVAVEAVGAEQAARFADDLAQRAIDVVGAGEESVPVDLGSLLDDAPAPTRGALPAVIGREEGEPFVIDLVRDGPHAVVAGVTGSGKSELLVTWIVALCSTHSTSEVSFLLADFKGGTAFDALAEIPHVTGVITDLDGTGARRAIESLRAEVRRRETELARAGARDILDPAVDMPRLVIVVDEFAALLGEHPELHAVFTDVAARGRALGMHLVLGTQRPSGVVRESLLANCPLRISLRVTDAHDSRSIVGTDAAAALPGEPSARGTALVRGASDAVPRRVRIALSSRADADLIAASARGPRPRRPWLPPLPGHIGLEELATRAGDAGDSLLLGLADEPDSQRQRPDGVRTRDRGLLVVGSSGSGKSTALRTIAAQGRGAVLWVPGTGEEAWDAVAALSERPPASGAVVLIDDLDAIGGALPADYARELIERIERLVRGAGDAGFLVVASAQRLAGGAARIADLMPRRLVLGSTTRAEHIALGGDPAHYEPRSVPGRGRLDGTAIQIATADASPPAPAREAGVAAGIPAAPWQPSSALTGFVARRTPVSRATAADWERNGARVISLDEFASAEWPSAHRVVVAGDAEEWQRHWRALVAMRSDHDLVVDSTCAAEFRLLTGERALPPYCEPGRARGWLLRAGGEPERIALPTDRSEGREHPSADGRDA